MLAAGPQDPEEVQTDLDHHMLLGPTDGPQRVGLGRRIPASPSAGATTGHLLVVDGGWTTT